MRQYVWTLSVVVCLIAFCNVAESRSLTKRQAGDGLDPVAHEADSDDDSDAARDKRSGKEEALFGVKNAVLGFVFNKPITGARAGFAWEVDTTTTTTPKGPTTTEDIVIFEKGAPVSLQIPDQLFGSSFSLVTNVSQTVGDFMINSALRAQRLLESMRPFLRGIFGAKGIVIEATTDKPIFSANSI